MMDRTCGGSAGSAVSRAADADLLAEAVGQIEAFRLIGWYGGGGSRYVPDEPVKNVVHSVSGSRVEIVKDEHKTLSVRRRAAPLNAWRFFVARLSVNRGNLPSVRPRRRN